MKILCRDTLNKLKQHLRRMLKYRGNLVLRFLKWVIISVFVGSVMSVVGSAFRIMFDGVTEFRQSHTFIIYFLPLAGLFIVFCYQTLGFRHDKGTNLVLMAVRDNEKLTIKTMLLIFSSTIVTHLFGGSSGREGAALQIGGSFSASLGRLLRLDEKDQRIITMCGMSAGFSSIFGTPITSAVFSMEVTSVGIMHYSALVPSVLSAVVANTFTSFFGISSEGFSVLNIPKTNLLTIFKVILLAVLCALMAEIFVIVLKAFHHIFQRISNNKYIRVLIGSAAIIALTLIVGSQTYNGAGMDFIKNSFSESVGGQHFILKLIFTGITLGCGFKGGEIVPAFFVGAAFGNFMSGFLGLDFSFGASIGLIAVFCGVTNCPLTSLFMSLELFGMGGIVLYAIACAVAYMLSGYRGLYNSQKIVYSKTKAEFIDKRINT